MRTSSRKSYIQFVRGDKDFYMLIRQRPSAYVLLSLIAQRARRAEDSPKESLQIGESFIGDYRTYGSTEQRYRSDKKFLEEAEFIICRATNKGTVARLAKSTPFDINPDSLTTKTDSAFANDQSNDQSNDLTNDPANDQAYNTLDHAINLNVNTIPNSNDPTNDPTNGKANTKSTTNKNGIKKLAASNALSHEDAVQEILRRKPGKSRLADDGSLEVLKAGEWEKVRSAQSYLEKIPLSAGGLSSISEQDLRVYVDPKGMWHIPRMENGKVLEEVITTDEYMGRTDV